MVMLLISGTIYNVEKNANCICTSDIPVPLYAANTWRIIFVNILTKRQYATEV
jgi:hypothetical protein